MSIEDQQKFFQKIQKGVQESQCIAEASNGPLLCPAVRPLSMCGDFCLLPFGPEPLRLSSCTRECLSSKRPP